MSVLLAATLVATSSAAPAFGPGSVYALGGVKMAEESVEGTDLDNLYAAGIGIEGGPNEYVGFVFEFERATNSERNEFGRVTVSTNEAIAGGRGTLPLGRVRLFAEAGTVFAALSSRFDPDSGAARSDGDGGVGWFGGAGASLSVHRNINIGITVRASRCRTADGIEIGGNHAFMTLGSRFGY